MSTILVSTDLLHHADVVQDALEEEYPHLAFATEKSRHHSCVTVTSEISEPTRRNLCAFARGVLRGYRQAT